MHGFVRKAVGYLTVHSLLCILATCTTLKVLFPEVQAQLRAVIIWIEARFGILEANCGVNQFYLYIGAHTLWRLFQNGAARNRNGEVV